MRKEFSPTLKEYYVYRVHFDSLAYVDESDDPYDTVISYDGGTIEDATEIIYDGGGVE
jgi:hypothetical protein